MLWEFLKSYDSIGYSIEIVEQAPDISEQFEQDIYRNIMFNYLILKGYLQDAEDRKIPTPKLEEKRTLHPKFVKEIIEELTEDYDLPDVEIRKILIEELTKEQLMEEEAAARLRLVEEQAQRRSEEEKRLEALRLEEEERLRLEDEQYRELYVPELEYFWEHLTEHLMRRREEDENSGLHAPIEDFEDAALQLEIAEHLRREAEEEELRQQELAEYRSYFDEISYFDTHLSAFLEMRRQEEEEERRAEELRLMARQERQAKKQLKAAGILRWRRG